MAERQTASEWLLTQYAKNSILSLNDFREAGRMEKEEIMDAYDNGYLDFQILMHENAQDYYEKTYW
jgi:hypothetical protein